MNRGWQVVVLYSLEKDIITYVLSESYRIYKKTYKLVAVIGRLSSLLMALLFGITTTMLSAFPFGSILLGVDSFSLCCFTSKFVSHLQSMCPTSDVCGILCYSSGCVKYCIFFLLHQPFSPPIFLTDTSIIYCHIIRYGSSRVPSHLHLVFNIHTTFLFTPFCSLQPMFQPHLLTNFEPAKPFPGPQMVP